MSQIDCKAYRGDFCPYECVEEQLRGACRGGKIKLLCKAPLRCSNTGQCALQCDSCSNKLLVHRSKCPADQKQTATNIECDSSSCSRNVKLWVHGTEFLCQRQRFQNKVASSECTCNCCYEKSPEKCNNVYCSCTSFKIVTTSETSTETYFTTTTNNVIESTTETSTENYLNGTTSNIIESTTETSTENYLNGTTSNYFYKTTSNYPGQSQPNAIGGIVGGAVGALSLTALLIVVAIWYRRHRSGKAPSAVAYEDISLAENNRNYDNLQGTSFGHQEVSPDNVDVIGAGSVEYQVKGDNMMSPTRQDNTDDGNPAHGLTQPTASGTGGNYFILEKQEVGNPLQEDSNAENVHNKESFHDSFSRETNDVKENDDYNKLNEVIAAKYESANTDYDHIKNKWNKNDDDINVYDHLQHPFKKTEVVLDSEYDHF